MAIAQWAADIAAGDRRAIGRAMTAIERGAEGSEALLDALHPRTGRAFRLGITGPPGAGKSTLVAQLTTHYRTRGLSVGIVAVDPSSPFSGGALLGDRIRMLELTQDTDVFMRSMAARGALGGLSAAAQAAADVLDAAGKDVVILETVGVGQSELDIAGAADATVVVLVPESGDAVQAMKAGLMEIADLFVVNKCDRPGADQAVAAIERILHFRAPPGPQAWRVPVLQAAAAQGQGLAPLAEAIEGFRAHQAASGGGRDRRERQARQRVRDIVNARRQDGFWDADKVHALTAGGGAVVRRELSPLALARLLLQA